jgi:vitamin B12/bleomycin/antimicrobial peptide transport system ATP-binding/permease protein
MEDIKKIWKLIVPYWRSEEKFKAWALLFFVMGLSLSNVWLLIRLNQFTRDVYNAFERKSYIELLHQIYIFIILIIVFVVVHSGKNIITGFLQFSWRRWLTTNFLARWSKDNRYYHVMLKRGHVDNPDQRISQDLRFLAFLSLDLFLIFLLEVVSLVSFAVILWKISANLPLQILGHQYHIKGYLLWIALIYSGIGTYLAVKIGKPLINLDFINEKYEADFRFSLIRLQEKREEAALYNGTQTEIGYLRDAFNNIQENFYAILVRTFYMNVYRAFYINLDQLIPLFSVSPMYFSGIVTLGVVMQVVSAFGHIMNSLAVIVNNFTNIASWRASVRRLLEFTDCMDESEYEALTNKIKIKTFREKINISDVSLYTPDNREILKNINFFLDKGDRVLLVGESGIGKSTIIRALAGLWTHGEGGVIIPKEKIFFVPQRPYMPITTLRQAILYPEQNLETKVLDSKIEKLLHDFKLGYLAFQLGDNKDWGSALSLGEQQRVSFIRILLHKPEWLIMDEPTSSLNDKLQELSFNLLFSNLKNPTILTVGHTKELRKFHTKIINVENWVVE